MGIGRCAAAWRALLYCIVQPLLLILMNIINCGSVGPSNDGVVFTISAKAVQYKESRTFWY